MKKGFTLAEILITLAIIGIVAALTIPSVISNAQQQEFKTGLKKAVTVLNQAITTNLALDGDTPYTTKDKLGDFLARHMSVIKINNSSQTNKDDNIIIANYAFYTTDGMRFEIDDGRAKGFGYQKLTFYDPPESEKDAKFNDSGNGCDTSSINGSVWKCGSYGLATNPNNTKCSPCIVLVDVNGDKKPSKLGTNSADEKNYVWTQPDDGYLTDIFNLMVTESRVIPYGTVAQKAMYEER